MLVSVTSDGACIFSRDSCDNTISNNSSKRKGTQLINSMNAVNMIILNGIDSDSQYTYESKNGNSIIDYIIVSDNLLMPFLTSDNKSSNLNNKSNEIPVIVGMIISHLKYAKKLLSGIIV